MQNIRLFIDTETTGFSPRDNTIIQIAMILDIDGQIIDTFNIFVRPVAGARIQWQALKAIGVNERDFNKSHYVNDEQAFYDVLDFMAKHKLEHQKFTIIGHNIDKFDLPFMQIFFLRNNDNLDNFDYDTFDTSTYAAKNLKQFKKRSLGFLCQQFDVNLTNAHDALADITANRELFYKITA